MDNDKEAELFETLGYMRGKIEDICGKIDKQSCFCKETTHRIEARFISSEDRIGKAERHLETVKTHLNWFKGIWAFFQAALFLLIGWLLKK